MHTTASPRHRFKPPTFKRGEDHPTANLSDVEVLELRQLKAEGHITYKQLGERFNCSASTAQSIGSYSRRHYAANGQELRPDYRPPIKRASPLTEAPSPEGVSKPEGNTVPINAKLSDNDVRLMRELREQYGLSYQVLADKFDCSKTNARRICTYERRTYDAKGKPIVSGVWEPVKPPGISKGEQHVNARLTDNDVRLMRELREQYGMSYRKLADKFDCSVTNVSRIVNYESRL